MHKGCIRTVVQGMAPKCKLDWACQCSRAFPTILQALLHERWSKQQLCRLAAVQPPPCIATKRQKLLEQPELPAGQTLTGNTDSQQVQHEQPVRSDFFDALSGGRWPLAQMLWGSPSLMASSHVVTGSSRHRQILQPSPP